MNLRLFPSRLKTGAKSHAGTVGVLAVLAGGAGVFLLSGGEPADKRVPDPDSGMAPPYAKGLPANGGAPGPASGGRETFGSSSAYSTRPRRLPPAEDHAGRTSDGDVHHQGATLGGSAGNPMPPSRQRVTHLSGPALPGQPGPDAVLVAEQMAAPPRFRPVRVEPQPGDRGDPPAAVVLDFAAGQQLPAVLAAPDAGGGVGAGAGSSLQQMQENRIAGEFISAVTAPAGEHNEPAVDPSGSLSSVPVSGSASDTRWSAAVRQADEEFRALMGQEVYQQKALEAAILRRQAAEVPH